jgi:membrane protease YdiL (CAAX protease family)
MNKKGKNILKVAVFALMAVALIFQILVFVYPSGAQILGGYLTLAYISLGIAIFTMLIFPIIRMFSNPKGAIKFLIGIAAIVIIGLIFYLIASNDFTPQQLEKLRVTESTSNWVEAGLNATFTVGIVAILAAIFLAIKGSISK